MARSRVNFDNFEAYQVRTPAPSSLAPLAQLGIHIHLCHSLQHGSAYVSRSPAGVPRTCAALPSEHLATSGVLRCAFILPATPPPGTAFPAPRPRRCPCATASSSAGTTRRPGSSGWWLVVCVCVGGEGIVLGNARMLKFKWVAGRAAGALWGRLAWTSVFSKRRATHSGAGSDLGSLDCGSGCGTSYYAQQIRREQQRRRAFLQRRAYHAGNVAGANRQVSSTQVLLGAQ